MQPLRGKARASHISKPRDLGHADPNDPLPPTPTAQQRGRLRASDGCAPLPLSRGLSPPGEIRLPIAMLAACSAPAEMCRVSRSHLSWASPSGYGPSPSQCNPPRTRLTSSSSSAAVHGDQAAVSLPPFRSSRSLCSAGGRNHRTNKHTALPCAVAERF